MGRYGSGDGTRGGSVIAIVSGPEVGKWVCERVSGHWKEESRSIGMKNGKMIAGVVYEDFNGANVLAHIATEGQLTRRFVKAIFHYPFDVLQASRITAMVKSNNARSVRLLEHFGFKREATLGGFYPDADMYVYAMRRDECRWRHHE